jgi:hypothetical protein
MCKAGVHFASSKLFSYGKNKVKKQITQQTFAELIMSLIFNHEEHLLRSLAHTGTSSSSILEEYTSAIFIKIIVLVQTPGVQSTIPKINGIIRVVTDFRKNRTQLIVRMSPVSYPKDWGMLT